MPSYSKSQISKHTDEHNRTAPLNSSVKGEYQLEFIQYEVDETGEENEDQLGDKLGSAGDGEINILIDEQRFDRASSDDNLIREHGFYKIVDKTKRNEQPHDEPPAYDLNLNPKDQKRLHEHSPLPRSPVSEKHKIANRVSLPPDLIREGNRIIEQLYVDEIINAIDEVIELTADKLIAIKLARQTHH